MSKTPVLLAIIDAYKNGIAFGNDYEVLGRVTKLSVNKLLTRESLRLFKTPSGITPPNDFHPVYIIFDDCGDIEIDTDHMEKHPTNVPWKYGPCGEDEWIIECEGIYGEGSTGLVIADDLSETTARHIVEIHNKSLEK